MPIISIRVDEGTKKAMNTHKDVKWSEVIREGIKKRLKEENTRKVERGRLLKAVKLTGTLRRKSPGFDSTKEIRRWREVRR
jgi:Arc/MetJ-type ribon-helix-helix transcriptional regulator